MKEFFTNHIENVFYPQGIFALFCIFGIACLLRLLWNVLWEKKEPKKKFFLKSFIMAYIPVLLVSGTNSEFLGDFFNAISAIAFAIMFALVLFSIK